MSIRGGAPLRRSAAAASVVALVLACGLMSVGVAGCAPQGRDLSEEEPSKPRPKPPKDAGSPELPSFDAGTDPDRNAVGPGELCARFAAIQCAAERSCCNDPGRDLPACLDALASSCAADLLFDQIAGQASAGFDADQARIVLDEYERLAAQCDPGIAAFAESQDGLRSMFTGTVEPGGNCRPSNLLDKVMSGAALSACTESDHQACLPSATTWRCTERSEAGGTCFTDINCLQGFYCPNPDFDLAGATCLERKGDGEDCSTGNECASLFCVGRTCVPADQQAAYCP